jgi:hypothetical protein
MVQCSVWMSVCLTLISFAFPVNAQQVTAISPRATVPPIVNLSGVLSDVNGKPLTDVAGVTFYLYRDSEGGAPLWMETQNVHPDRTGHYSVILGSTTSQGLPASLFASGEAHWLATQPQGQPEQPRILLLSVPYALKASDADTLGGLPASAFIKGNAGNSSNLVAVPLATPEATKQGARPSSLPVTTPGGAAGMIPEFSGTSEIVNSQLQYNNSSATLTAVNLIANSVNQGYNAAPFSGTGNGDIGDRVNQVYKQCPSAGCRIRIPPNPAGGCWNFSTPITITTPTKPAVIEGDPAGATCLNFTPSTGNAVSLDWAETHLGAGGVRDITLIGPGKGSGNGITLGPTRGIDQAVLSGVNIQSFGAACLQFNAATNITVEKSQIHNCVNGAIWTRADELDRFVDDDVFGNTNFGFNLPVNSVDLQISGGSCDDNMNGCINNGTSVVFIHGSHFENIGHTTATYIVNAGGIVVIDGGNMMDDIPSGTVDAFIHNQGGVLICPDLNVYSGGQTVTQVILSSTNKGTAGLTNCHIQNSTPALIRADYNTSYTAGQAITWPYNHGYSTINWLNSPISVGNGNFSVSTSGTIPLILNCVSASSCGLWLQKQGTVEWQISVDSNNDFILSNASNSPVFQLTQAGKVSLNPTIGTSPVTITSAAHGGNFRYATAAAFDHSPAECENNNVATGNAANGDLSCSTITSAHLDPSLTTYAASLTTTESTSDNVSIPGVSSSSYCALTATNASAAANSVATYISAKITNQITIAHGAKSGMTYDIICKAD